MLIHVKVETESREEKIISKNSTSYVVKVRVEAKNNQANNSMLSLLADYLKIDRTRLRIVTGHHSPSKILEILEYK